MGNDRHHDLDRLLALMEKYQQGTASPAEIREIDRWYDAHADDPTYRESLSAIEQMEVRKRLLYRVTEQIHREGLETTPQKQQRRLRLRTWLPYAAAAAILIMALAGTYIFFGEQLNLKSKIVNLKSEDIQPGGNRATLTLADGTTITLDEAQEGIIIDDESISYSNDSSFVILSGSEGSHPPEMLALTTPKGGTYQLTLPDGSKVWLNANSTLKYPSKFTGDERVVFLEGEAYFDIRESVNQGTSESVNTGKTGSSDSQTHRLTNSPKVPFKVVSNSQEVQVLGTEFNISAYPDEAEIKTTLVEGSVRLGLSPAGGGRGRFVELKPGDQAIIRQSSDKTDIHQVDVHDYTDWKNGEFVFREETVQQAMRRLARWYDVEVLYASDIPDDERFSGTISRYDQLSTVLQIMEEAGGIQFEISGRSVLVRKKTTDKTKN